MRIAAVLCLLAAVWFLLPLAAGVSHIGMYFGAAVLFCAALACLFRRRLCGWLGKRSAFVRAAAAMLCGAALLLPAALFSVMRAAHTDIDDLPRGSVVVVLGCGVNGTSPSAMLRARCEHALAVLQRDETAVCVASGGQGPGEDITEAEAIRRFLTERGIDGSRIYLEQTSTDTKQNVENSLALIRNEGLSGEIVLVSDRFHLYRGQMYARRLGTDVLGSGCGTDPFLAPGYWVRDMGGVLLLLLGADG